MAVAWRRAGELCNYPDKALAAAWACLYCSLGFFVSATLPFVLWAFGIIADYKAALILTAGLSIMELVWSIRLVKRKALQAV